MFSQYLKNWINRYFPDEDTIFVLIIFLTVSGLIYFYSGILMPVLIALALSFILVAPLRYLEKLGIPPLIASILLMSIFVTIGVMAITYLIPIIIDELKLLINNTPTIIESIKLYVVELQSKHTFFTAQVFIDGIENVKHMLLDIPRIALNNSISSLVSFASIAMYLIIIPMLMFFMLNDRNVLLKQIASIFPKSNTLMSSLLQQMKQMITQYMVSKLFEIFIVSIASWLSLAAFGLDFALLLGVLTGLAVIIPYVGTLIAIIPITMVGLAQWGGDSILIYCLSVYLAVQFIDAYVVVPFLFSDTMNLRPFWILFALIIFGSVWGFWGIVFAIPLATLIKIIIESWPVNSHVGPTQEIK